MNAQPTRRAPWLRWLPALIAALLLVILAVPAGLRLYYADQIYPGVSVAGEPLGGLSSADARQRLRAAGLDPTRELELLADTETLRMAAGKEGIGLDEEATIAAALAVGRERGLWSRTLVPMRAALMGRAVPPVVRVDEAALAVTLARLAKGFDRAPRDAAIVLDGSTPRAVDAMTGRGLDQAQAFAGLREAAAAGQWPIVVSDCRLLARPRRYRSLAKPWHRPRHCCKRPSPCVVERRAGSCRPKPWHRSFDRRPTGRRSVWPWTRRVWKGG